MFSYKKKTDSMDYMEAVIEQIEENEKNRISNLEPNENIRDQHINTEEYNEYYNINTNEKINNKYSADECLEAKEDNSDFLDNKIFAQVPYILGTLGVIIALLVARNSKYVIFHVKQSLELIVCNVILTIILIPMLILSCMKDVGTTFLIIAVIIGLLQFIVFVLRFIGFLRAGSCKVK